MIVNENNSLPYMKSLTACMRRLAQEGYEAQFMIDNEGLHRSGYERHYQHNEVNIVNFFRFEGESDPDDNAILYVIETNDGCKGTLTDAYGTYQDEAISAFVQEVHSIYKKTEKTN